MNNFQEYYSQLNDQQKKAVDALDGPVLVLAGPGTGKTQLLSIRAANIIREKRAEPENILILTFTNAAARAMRERLASIIGHDGYNIEVETFHSFSNSIVLESEDAIKYVRDKIDISDIEKVRALKYILDTAKGVEPLKPFGAPYIHLNEIRSRISELKNEGISPGALKEDIKDLKPDGINLEDKHIARLKALSIIYENYEALKDQKCKILFDERGRKDFDDMILIALEALKKEKALKDFFRKQYQYIMVDEYQDTNGAQLELLFSILDPKHSNLCCVGDDDQAIYRFQGATLANFRILEEKLPKLKTIVLKENYRSTKKILDLTSQVISQLPEKERVDRKTLTCCKKYTQENVDFLEFLTEEEELAFIINKIKEEAEKIKKDKTLSEEEREKPFNNIAILVRKRSQRQKVIEAFLKAGIPYALGDKSDSKEDIRLEKRVRQMLDVLDLANTDLENNDKKSLALYKILTSDYIGASHADILKFIGFVNSLKSGLKEGDVRRYRTFNLFQAFQDFFPTGETAPIKEESEDLEITKKLGFTNVHALHKAAWAIKRLLEDARARAVHDILMRYIDDTGLYRFLLKEYENSKIIRVRDLRALVSFINMVKQSSLSKPSYRLDDLTEELDLREIHDMPINGELATLSQDGVRIYTAHSAKGLEFLTVFIPFCLEQKSWPVRSKPDVIPLPPEIYKSKEKVDEKKKLKLLNYYDELRLFYVASTRAKANLYYTATPGEKVIISRFLSEVNISPKKGTPKKEDKFLADFLRGKSDRDPFRDVEGILKDQVNKMHLTPTMLNSYIACRRKFLYNYILRLPGKKTQHLVFGNCAHKALEDVYFYYRDSKKFPSFSFFEKAFKKELEFQGVTDSIKNMCISRMDTLKNWYKLEEDSSPRVPLFLEKDLVVTIGPGIMFKGKFDKIELEDDGSVRVIDYKTGKPDKHVKAVHNCRDLAQYGCDEYYRQLIAYKLVFEKNEKGKDKKAVSKGLLQFLEPASETVKKYNLEKGTFRDIEIELTDSMVQDLERLIIKCWQDIQGLNFDKLPERDAKMRCARCEFDSICWQE